MKTLALLMLSAAITFAADISGKWTLNVVLDAGSGAAQFEFHQDGEKLTGKYSGAVGQADVTGTVKGDKVEFSFTTQAGTVKYSGSLEGDKKMSGTCEYGELGNGKFDGTKNP
ncbi:MAG TPA: hypothetical protein VKS01_07435 [Bryobacteraceae bacterium]|nr:hypothetical protein [Bryobacteraceae bacterium]